MLIVDTICQPGHHSFERARLRGEENASQLYPRCNTSLAPPVQGPASRFDGIEAFRSLAKERNATR